MGGAVSPFRVRVWARMIVMRSPPISASTIFQREAVGWKTSTRRRLAAREVKAAMLMRPLWSDLRAAARLECDEGRWGSLRLVSIGLLKFSPTSNCCDVLGSVYYSFHGAIGFSGADNAEGAYAEDVGSYSYVGAGLFESVS